jgi:hypothetical protein
LAQFFKPSSRESKQNNASGLTEKQRTETACIYAGHLGRFLGSAVAALRACGATDDHLAEMFGRFIEGSKHQ